MTARTPEQHLAALAELAQALAVAWPTYQATEAALGNPTTRANSDTGGHGGDTPDPTGNIAASHIWYWATATNIEDALTYLRAAQRRMTTVRKHHSELARKIDTTIAAARCSGAIDPTCTNNAVVHDGKHAGLCWRCIKRQQRSEASG